MVSPPYNLNLVLFFKEQKVKTKKQHRGGQRGNLKIFQFAFFNLLGHFFPNPDLSSFPPFPPLRGFLILLLRIAEDMTQIAREGIFSELWAWGEIKESRLHFIRNKLGENILKIYPVCS